MRRTRRPRRRVRKRRARYWAHGERAGSGQRIGCTRKVYCRMCDLRCMAREGPGHGKRAGGQPVGEPRGGHEGGHRHRDDELAQAQPRDVREEGAVHRRVCSAARDARRHRMLGRAPPPPQYPQPSVPPFLSIARAPRGVRRARAAGGRCRARARGRAERPRAAARAAVSARRVDRRSAVRGRRRAHATAADLTPRTPPRPACVSGGLRGARTRPVKINRSLATGIRPRYSRLRTTRGNRTARVINRRRRGGAESSTT